MQLYGRDHRFSRGCFRGTGMKGEEGARRCFSHNFNVAWAQKFDSCFWILRLVFAICIFILQSIRGSDKCRCPRTLLFDFTRHLHWLYSSYHFSLTSSHKKNRTNTLLVKGQCLSKNIWHFVLQCIWLFYFGRKIENNW